ncbi:MAG: DUF4339 domain-containing protein [Verrucomicrobia bacterium]|jgi:hypothetical protein|nr:DUF4339 domain-containing protein [Verrucomicrobiota bacterium]
MSDYYIRTPEQDESRGPFDTSKLNTLADAGQINPNTLYYDEEKEDWIPLARNADLLAEVFPTREKLSLNLREDEEAPMKGKKKADSEDEGVQVENMLAAAEGDTRERRKQTQLRKSLEKATSIAAVGLAVMMLLSALIMILPLIPEMEQQLSANSLAIVLNYPVILVGMFDFLMAVLLLLSVTEVYPLLRGRAMLGLGFGAYVGWAIGDPMLVGLTIAAGLGVFMATLAQRMSTLVLAFILGIGGHGYLAFLALNGRFDGFFERIVFNFVG